MAGVLSRVTDWEIARFLGWSTVSFSGGLMLGAYCALVAREENGLESLVPYAQKMITVFGVFFFVIAMVPRYMHLDLAIHYVSWFFFFSIIVLTVSSSRDGRGFLAKFFNLRIMRLFGKVSYGLVRLPLCRAAPPGKVLSTRGMGHTLSVHPLSWSWSSS